MASRTRSVAVPNKLLLPSRGMHNLVSLKSYAATETSRGRIGHGAGQEQTISEEERELTPFLPFCITLSAGIRQNYKASFLSYMRCETVNLLFACGRHLSSICSRELFVSLRCTTRMNNFSNGCFELAYPSHVCRDSSVSWCSSTRPIMQLDESLANCSVSCAINLRSHNANSQDPLNVQSIATRQQAKNYS